MNIDLSVDELDTLAMSLLTLLNTTIEYQKIKTDEFSQQKSKKNIEDVLALYVKVHKARS